MQTKGVDFYPHITHDEGLKSMRQVIGEFEKESDCVISAQDLVELAELIFENNFFKFNNEIYRQKSGTAIGTKFAPLFMNMFMFKLERRMLREYHLTPLVWWRFLDDEFLIWVYGRETLKQFSDYANPCQANPCHTIIG